MSGTGHVGVVVLLLFVVFVVFVVVVVVVVVVVCCFDPPHFSMTADTLTSMDLSRSFIQCLPFGQPGKLCEHPSVLFPRHKILVRQAHGPNSLPCLFCGQP